jgi:hypothetical protein
MGKKILVITIVFCLVLSANVFAFNINDSFSLPLYTNVFSNDKVDVFIETKTLLKVSYDYHERKRKNAYEQPFNVELVYVYKSENILKEIRKSIKKTVSEGGYSTYPTNLEDIDKINGLVEAATFDFTENKVNMYRESGINTRENNFYLRFITNCTIEDNVSLSDGEFPEIKRNILLFFEKTK